MNIVMYSLLISLAIVYVLWIIKVTIYNFIRLNVREKIENVESSPELFFNLINAMFVFIITIVYSIIFIPITAMIYTIDLIKNRNIKNED